MNLYLFYYFSIILILIRLNYIIYFGKLTFNIMITFLIIFLLLKLII